MTLRAFTGFVFLPPDVERLLAELAHLAAALPRPVEEGEPSAAFSAARRSRRELYRALANPQWPHLVELLQMVDECVGAGVECARPEAAAHALSCVRSFE